MRPPILTVVDYNSWDKGYMPPTEHVLIDALSHRGAKVILGSDHGAAGAFWLVVRGKRPSRGRMRKIMELLLDDLEDEKPFEPQRFTIFMDGADRFVLCDAESDEPTNPVYATREEAEAALKVLQTETET